MNNIHTRISSGILLLAKLGVFCLLAAPLLAYSQERVLAVMSNNGKIYQDFYSALNNKLHEDIKVSKINFSELNNEILNNHNIIISIGYKAAKIVSKHTTKSTIIYSLIPDDELLQRNLSCKKMSCYKIYINQPVTRYIKLYKVLFPKGKRLVFATTNKNSKVLEEIESTAKKNSISYKNIHVQKDENIPRAFIKNLNNTNDVLLALPNPAIYNANNAKSIILSTYHANVPIIAYSKSFANAGALISLFSSIDNIADKTAHVVNKLSTRSFLEQKEYYPDEFMIKINTSVARSLNINHDSEDVIKRKIK